MEEHPMMRHLMLPLAALALLAATVQEPAWACMRGGRNVWSGCSVGCGDCAGCGECGTVTRTVYVPECTTEMRTVPRTRYHQEQREKTITVTKRVPITEERTATYTVMVPETRTKTVTYNVCKPVWETMTREYTVNGPYTEPIEQT